MGGSRDWIIGQREDESWKRAGSELETLALADEASRVLADVASQVTIGVTESDPGSEQLRLHAVWLMAIITFRALRAAMQVIAIGYEDQAAGFHRLIDEALNRAKAIDADVSGDQARAWLKGKNIGSGAKLVGQDLWELLSGPLHANVRAILDWIAVSEPNGTRVILEPERRPGMANATLTHMAGEARDIAKLLADRARINVDLTALDTAVRAAQAEHIPENGGE